MSAGWNRQKVLILALISSSSIICAVDRSSLSMANTFIAKELNLSLTQMGLVLSSFGWAYLFFNLPSGRLCDRFGVK
jgi:ACS family D-galactonate transporter-like MFS transporter